MLIEQARARAQERKLPGWVLSLDQPTYVAVVTDAESERPAARLLRGLDHARLGPGPQRRALGQLAGDGGDPAGAARGRRSCWGSATTPSTPSPRAWRTASRRCSSSWTSCAGAARAAAQAEFAELEDFAGRTLDAWDVGFCSERLQRERFQVSQEELRPYFPLPRVLAGLFEVAERLFGVRDHRAPGRAGVASGCAPVRNRRCPRGAGGQLLPGPLRAPAQAQRRLDGRVRRPQAPAAGAVLPVAYLVCNFLPPRGGAPGAAHPR